MTTTFAALLLHHFARSCASMSHAARQAGLPKQTLFHWLRGRTPRWHARLPLQLHLLSQALGMDASASQQLLAAGGCTPGSNQHPAGEKTMKRKVPSGWHCAGSQPQDYDMGLDAAVDADGGRTVILASRTRTARGFGTFMQGSRAHGLIGQRLRFSALVRSEDVDDWAGLWFRIDAKEAGRTLGFDNMSNRPITGTTPWTRHAVVLDVPEGSKGLAYGILLSGTGRVWIGGVRIEPVGADVAVTNMSAAHDEPGPPRNLDFEQ
ncbi:MAG: hypothetical protein WAT39_02450 [Planctomycetota bacterium]